MDLNSVVMNPKEFQDIYETQHRERFAFGNRREVTEGKEVSGKGMAEGCHNTRLVTLSLV